MPDVHNSFESTPYTRRLIVSLYDVMFIDKLGMVAANLVKEILGRMFADTPFTCA
jgi:hypothetical protein